MTDGGDLRLWSTEHALDIWFVLCVYLRGLFSIQIRRLVQHLGETSISPLMYTESATVISGKKDAFESIGESEGDVP